MADHTTSLLRPRLAAGSFDPSAVIIDERRSRPVWFDGQYVTATAFNAEQSYLLVRQADLGQALGAGVVTGLHVSRAEGSTTALVVSPGQGIAGAGETIAIHAPLRIDLASLAGQRELGQGLGLNRRPAAPLETRSGVFVLVATPLEYTSNPVGSYPTTLDGERRLEDSVINEAVLLALVPYGLAGATSPEQREAAATRRIFAEGAEPEVPRGSLALAMLELDGNRIVWLDEDMVRREAGALKSDVFGLGIAPEPLRAAHMRQYDMALERLMGEAPSSALQARQAFRVLPPMGRMPAAAVGFRTPPGATAPVLMQTFFPHPMPVDLAAIPEDELAALMEESFLLPPIDLEAGPEVLDDTPVTIFVPVRRAALAGLPASVRDTATPLAAPPPIGVLPTAPRDLLDTLISAAPPAAEPTPVEDAEWQALLGGQAVLWFARRRQFARRDAPLAVTSPFRVPANILGQDDEATAPDATVAASVAGWMDGFGLGSAYAKAKDRVADDAGAALDRLMLALARHGAALPAEAALVELPADRIGPDAVATVAERFGKGERGATVARLEGLLLGSGLATPLRGPTGRRGDQPAAGEDTPEAKRRGRLAGTRLVPELDAALAKAPAEAVLKAIDAVAKAVTNDGTTAAQLRTAVQRAIRSIEA